MSDSLKDILKQYLESESATSSDEEAREAVQAFRQFQGRRDAALMRRRNSWRLAFTVSAACIVIVAGLLFGIHWGPDTGVFTASAPVGEVVSITLPDGSLVWLNSFSSISCSKGFGVKNRSVSISGEGYFEVVKNEDLPMVVNTGKSTVTVLGTKFDICDFPEDAEASVVLFEGHVSFSNNDGESLDLIPGQSAVLDKNSNRLAYTNRDASLPAVWRDGILVFEDCSLERICRELSGAYGTALRITEPAIKDLRFTAEFNVRTQTLADVLDALSLTRHISFRITEAGAEIF